MYYNQYIVLKFIFLLDSLEDLLQQLNKFIEKDQDKIAERYNMITMEELDNQFNTLKNKKRKHKSMYLFILHYFVYQFNNKQYSNQNFFIS